MGKLPPIEIVTREEYEADEREAATLGVPLCKLRDHAVVEYDTRRHRLRDHVLACLGMSCSGDPEVDGASLEDAMVCWEDDHSWLALLSMLTLVMYVLSTTLVSPFFMEDYTGMMCSGGACVV